MYRDYAKLVKQNLNSRLMVEGVGSETQTAQRHIPEDCMAMKISNLCNAPPPTQPPTIYRQYLPPILYASYIYKCDACISDPHWSNCGCQFSSQSGWQFTFSHSADSRKKA